MGQRFTHVEQLPHSLKSTQTEMSQFISLIVKKVSFSTLIFSVVFATHKLFSGLVVKP